MAGEFDDLDAEEDAAVDKALAATAVRDQVANAQAGGEALRVSIEQPVNVDEIPFDQVTPDQLGQLSDERLDAFMAFRDAGGRGAVDEAEVEQAPPAVPSWAKAEEVSEAEWASLMEAWSGEFDAYGGIQNEKRRREALTGGSES